MECHDYVMIIITVIHYRIITMFHFKTPDVQMCFFSFFGSLAGLNGPLKHMVAMQGQSHLTEARPSCKGLKCLSNIVRNSLSILWAIQTHLISYDHICTVLNTAKTWYSMIQVDLLAWKPKSSWEATPRDLLGPSKCWTIKLKVAMLVSLATYAAARSL